ncbi:MAG: OmpA family protein [Archangium sp.]|nr:OmpA family protein [Archangium sp.]
MKMLIAGSLLTASLAAAQTVPSADVEQLWLDPAGRGSLFVGNGRTLDATQFRVGVAGFYTHGNLRTTQAGTFTDLLQDRFGFQVFGALGLTDWLELGANVPVYVYQQGTTGLSLASAGLGNPWLQAKVNILDAHKPISLAVVLGVGLPLGTSAAQGNGGFEAAPRLQVGRVYDAWQYGIELGYLHRTTVDYQTLTNSSADRVGSQLYVAAMVTTVNPEGPRGEFTVRGFIPLAGGQPGVEGQLGFRWALGPVELIASAGPGFAGQTTTPAVRAYFGAAFANTPMTQPTCAEGRAYQLADCPDLDRDGDGVKNASDQAPFDPEDKDAFQDEDGAPDPDNDGDGTIDTLDDCTEVAGPAANRGCPDTDQDSDGVVDRLDQCVDQPEDKDDFEDSDGCPEADNDKDGFADGTDACPLNPGISQERGCPAKDTDGDTVFDHEDNCPSEQGVPENAGCPAAQKQLVIITVEKLKILDKVYFDTGKASIQKRSDALLTNIAQVLTVHPEIALIQIEGHTDTVGVPEKNKKLSQDRADSVKAYLVKKGVAENRLRAVGFGQEKPAETNETPAGREANRRVEFNIVSQ